MAEAALDVAPPRRIALKHVAGGAIALALAFAVGYWAVVLRGREATDDAFVEGHLVFLSARVQGNVVEVAVDENQRVEAGQLLVRLDPSDYEVRVARARADLEAARNRMLQSSAAAEAAAAQGHAAEAKLRLAERELDRIKSLSSSMVASAAQLDAALSARDAAAAEVRAAGERERAERAALGGEAPVRQAEAALREAELALEHTRITAPFAGVVGKKSVELGANVAAGQGLLALAADTGNWVVANFKETQIGRMHLGDPVEIRVDAFPDHVFRGRVESISPATGAKYALLPPDNATGNFTKVVQRVPVRIALDGNGAARSAASDGASDVAAGPESWRGDALPVGLSVNVSVRVR